ncbi:hypothetical protein [Leptolyngbya sp. ST-U4]|uniref:hypothetical protein n=1 Tax=Leptolyngbya sp. ST-U4 TaxID=2933912 RepID=UPI0032974562
MLILRSIALLKRNKWLGHHALSFSSLQFTQQRGTNIMSTEFTELLPLPPDEKGQIWIIGSREWVNHQINEFYVKRLATDRVQFTPIIPAPFARGKFMSVLER